MKKLKWLILHLVFFSFIFFFLYSFQPLTNNSIKVTDSSYNEKQNRCLEKHGTLNYNYLFNNIDSLDECHPAGYACPAVAGGDKNYFGFPFTSVSEEVDFNDGNYIVTYECQQFEHTPTFFVNLLNLFVLSIVYGSTLFLINILLKKDRKARR